MEDPRNGMTPEEYYGWDDTDDDNYDRDVSNPKDVATLAAAWLHSALDRFAEVLYARADEPESMLDEVFEVMALMLPADPEYADVRGAYDRLVR